MQGSLTALARRLMVAAVLMTALLVGSQSATAQDSDVGRVDTECSRDCVSRGYDGEQCARMCYVPPPNRLSAEDQDSDWDCMSKCVKNGSTYRECLPMCRKP